MKNTVYTHILKKMISKSKLSYCELENSVFVTDGIVGFFLRDYNQVFNLEMMENSSGIKHIVDLDFSFEESPLKPTGEYYSVGDELVQKFEAGDGRIVNVDSQFIKKFFPIKRGEYVLYQKEDLGPVFAINTETVKCDGLMMPIREGKS